MKNRGLMALLIVILMAASSCTPAPGSTPPIGQEPADEELGTIGAVLREAGNFTIFMEMAGAFECPFASTPAGQFVQTKHINILYGPDDHTVFAPTDAAFQEFFEASGITREQLTKPCSVVHWQVVLYHVLTGMFPSSQLTSGTINSINGYPLTVDRTNGLEINAAEVSATDIEANNGIIHVVDSLFPFDLGELLDAVAEPVAEDPVVEGLGTIGEVLAEAGDFSIFLEMVDAWEYTSGEPIVSQMLGGLLDGEPPVDLLNSPAELTVFAPTDAAFEAFFERTGLTRNDITQWGWFLNWEIMFYHILDFKVPSNQLDGLYFTYLGYPLLITRHDGIQVGFANLIKADIQASNGIIHVIDDVLRYWD